MFSAIIPRDEIKSSLVWSEVKAMLLAQCSFNREEDEMAGNSRIDLLIHELMTNMINHTSGDTCEVSVIVDGHQCFISCKTAPRGFLMKGFLPDGESFQKYFPDPEYFRKGTSLVIYRDADSRVIATVTSENDLVFHSGLLEEKEPGAEIPEHYGLSILCQLCDEVRYTHTAGSDDTFRLTVTLPTA